jgi:hypothetical protein
LNPGKAKRVLTFRDSILIGQNAFMCFEIEALFGKMR